MSGPIRPAAPAACGSGNAGSARQWQDAQGRHIDVRGLAPPGPLVAILGLVRSIGDGGPVIVHHDRDPKMLYPELAEIGWEAVRIDGEPGEVRLRLAPVPD
ncbi:DUF2249 domain-containing protein [Zeimonas arvi]|uniref:DUF2249 domain-containing protein n=1 Tax=Zeimonas arvi TaxID=2498847 RepID=A0A5C8P1U8_9BURK|nr:DUF2249 domain-containing protein [Zeimonas arvi]TXL67312.1 DUF2249 domain-containing protein [Zeimonas arvi]